MEYVKMRIDALPKENLVSKDPELLQKEKACFLRRIREDYIDENPYGIVNLSRPKVRDLIFESIDREEGMTMNTYAMCLMRNHYHWVVKVYDVDNNGKVIILPKLLQRLHSYWSFRINQIDGVTHRKVWQREAYDRMIRNDRHLEKAINYTVWNPVKARLTDNGYTWPFVYTRPVTESIFWGV